MTKKELFEHIELAIKDIIGIYVDKWGESCEELNANLRIIYKCSKKLSNFSYRNYNKGIKEWLMKK